MKGDYSRITFDPKKHYSGVLVQQGRVQTDADINEQFEIARHRMETEVKDFIGQSGTPEKNPGFEIKGENGDFLIGKGRFYVDGMLIENENDMRFTEQPDLPDEELPGDDGLYLAYLDVWRHHLTALEEPDMRDAALGDQDTAARLKNLWQVKLLRLGDRNLKLDDGETDRFKPGKEWIPADETKNSDDLPLSTGQLKARVSGTGSTLGNQLYRIEIHTPGQGEAASFKWSRDNGSIAAEVTGITDRTVTIWRIGRGMEEGFRAGEIIEVTNDKLELRGKPGVLAEINQAADDALTLKIKEKDEDCWYNDIIGGGSVAKTDRLRQLHTRARLWDATGSVKEGEWLKTENDIEIQFDADSGSSYYKSGDYWLIPSRTLMKNIYWERDTGGNPLSQPPYGVRHCYACLGVVVRYNGAWTLTNDLRVPFKNLVTGLVSKEGDTITGDMTFNKSLDVRGNIGVGVKSPVSRLDVNGDLTAEIIYARSIRAAKFEGGIEQIIKKLEKRIEDLEKKVGIK
ncbi:DUF6519 domain-containing protein [Desulfonema magnum]|uniref:Uncharacterized protein n=1 Tax=Desulfonema magnum TaxID=45655 RepID=A0A975BP53_9BACT|nr:DUF6519 domain-containing protein [Desulfonema magnum]QTA89078.1 Uncharacterized protein dnm_051260 [Desulfonema magnum]